MDSRICRVTSDNELKPYPTSRDMWGYLKKGYHQDNFARQFHLECAIAEYAYGTMSIQDYYSGFCMLWSEYDSIKYADVASNSRSSGL